MRPPRLLLACLAALALATGAGAARAGDGLITFTQQQRAEGALFGTQLVGLALGGSDPVPLPSFSENVGGASWSASGDRIAFASDGFGQWQVLVGDAFDGGFLDPASHDDQLDPALSPDGEMIAIVDQPYGGRMHLALYRTGGSVVSPFLTDAGSDARDPRWSPDGKQLAFSSNRFGSWNVYVVNADGSGLRAVAPTPANERVTDWSPDGKSLLVTGDGTGNQELYLVDVATGATKQLTVSAASDVAGVFSPSGTKIAFSSDRRTTFDVYVMNVDGTDLKVLTDDHGRDIVLDWQQRPNANAPVVTVSPAKLVRGKKLRVRYTVRDDDPYASISLGIEYATAHGGGEFSFGGSSPRVRADGSVRTYVVDSEIVDELLSRHPASVRFCVTALDPFFNGPSRGCGKVSVRRS